MNAFPVSAPHGSRSSRVEAATLIVLTIAAVSIVWHWIAARYGFHRDELATLYDAQHLAWGFVAYPPVTPFFGRLSLILCGDSLPGFRFFAALANAAVLVLTGLMAREMGGNRCAQLLAVMAALPACLGIGALMQYVSFDYLWWTLTAYFTVRLLRFEDPRWWVAVGAGIGLGVLTKYTIGVLALGIVAGVLFTPARRYLKSKWLWAGVAVSVLISLPNLIWQVQHQFVSLDFLAAIHTRDVRIGRTANFLPNQFKMTLFGAAIWIAGLWFCLFSRHGKRFRMLGWMWLTTLLIFLAAKGRDYYMLASYPMLYAAGSVWGEERVENLRRGWRNTARGVAWTALAFDAVLMTLIFLPMAPVGSRWWKFASDNNGDLVEEIGWPELVAEVARIHDSLPPAERRQTGILAANYGEAGAIDLYGPQYGLTPAISGVNSFWYRGYPEPPPDTLIVLGFGQLFRDSLFRTCELAGHTPRIDGVHNEETEDHPDIFVCRGFRQTWPEFWQHFHRFG